MILVAGGTGHLGGELLQLLAKRGLAVRVLTRDPERARRLLGNGPEFALGDARDPRSLEAALRGVDAVVSAMTGFGPGAPGPRAVDYQGNLNLIRACEAAGAGRFVLLSMYGAAADHPMELLRMKHGAEEALRASALDWTVVRPTVFMELWVGMIGDPLVKTGTATVFGRGDNPVNLVSARDVARFVELALSSPELSRQGLDVGGPENLTLNRLVGEIEAATGRKAKLRHIPVPLLRFTRILMRPIRPDLAGLAEAGIVADTVDMGFDAAPLQQRFPKMQLIRVADVVRQRFGERPAAQIPLHE